MNLRNVLIVLGTATVTAALTLALFAPRGGDRAVAAVQPVIAQPQLTSHDCTFTLKTDKATYEAGEAPVVEVTAANPTDKPVSVSVWVNVTSTSPTSPMSRMLPIPVALWSHEYAFNLAPDETKALSAACAAMPAKGNVAILLADQKNAIFAAGLGIPAAGGPNAVGQNAAPPATAQP